MTDDRRTRVRVVANTRVFGSGYRYRGGVRPGFVGPSAEVLHSQGQEMTENKYKRAAETLGKNQHYVDPHVYGQAIYLAIEVLTQRAQAHAAGDAQGYARGREDLAWQAACTKAALGSQEVLAFDLNTARAELSALRTQHARLVAENKDLNGVVASLQRQIEEWREVCEAGDMQAIVEHCKAAE